MKAKFVLPLMMAMALVGCGNSAPADPGVTPPGPGPSGEYTRTVVFSDFTADDVSKASEAEALAKMTGLVKGKMGNLVTADGVSFGENTTSSSATINTQINSVGYAYHPDAATEAEKVDVMYTLYLGTGSKGGELHFKFVDTLLKVKIYANTFYNWSYVSQTSAYGMTRDKNTKLSVNSTDWTLTQVTQSETKPEMESQEFTINGTELNLVSEQSTSSAKHRVIIHSMEFTFTTAK